MNQTPKATFFPPPICLDHPDCLLYGPFHMINLDQFLPRWGGCYLKLSSSPPRPLFETFATAFWIYGSNISCFMANNCSRYILWLFQQLWMSFLNSLSIVCMFDALAKFIYLCKYIIFCDYLQLQLSQVCVKIAKFCIEL